MKLALEALEKAVAFQEGGRQKAIDAVKALRAALSQPAEGGEADTGPRVLREVFALCEATEHALHDECNAHSVQDSTLFSRGRLFEAKSIRKAIGTWFQDEFCGRSFMGEPVATPPASAPPVQVPMTDDDVDAKCLAIIGHLLSRRERDRIVWRMAEAHHGIKPKDGE